VNEKEKNNISNRDEIQENNNNKPINNEDKKRNL